MLARLVPLLLLAGCGAAGPTGVYRTLATEAMDPAARVAIVGLVATDRHPAGIPITEAHRRDPDPAVRRLCYGHLIAVDGERAESWLREALDDPVEGVRVTGVLRADHVPE